MYGTGATSRKLRIDEELHAALSGVTRFPEANELRRCHDDCRRTRCGLRLRVSVLTHPGCRHRPPRQAA